MSSQNANPPSGYQSAATNPGAPQPISGTWSQEENPQILIQWTLKPSTGSDGATTYTAKIAMYQLIFDVDFPSPPSRGSLVPFSVADPFGGKTPSAQGSLVLTQDPLILEVTDLQLIGFAPQSVLLYSAGEGT